MAELPAAPRWISAADTPGFNFALEPKFPIGPFAVLAKLGAFVLGTGVAGRESGTVAQSYGAGFTYVFGDAPLGLRAEWTGIGGGADVSVVTAGGFLRW